MKEAFVPLGDSSVSEVRMRNAGRMRPPAGTAVVFDLDYDLLLATEREARRQLLAPWALVPLACLEKLQLDPYVARELHRQELRDKELRDVVNALFGKAGDWRVARCGEARHNDYARGVLDRTMAGGDDAREVDRFLEAFKTVARLKKSGPVKAAKAWALYFVLGCRVKGEPLPTKGETLQFVQSRLASGDIDSLKRNAWRDIFTGPILSALLRGRVGRPRKTGRARGK